MQHLILEEEILVALQGNLDYFCRYLGSGSSPSYYFVGMSLVGIGDALILRNDSPTRAARVIISEISFTNFSARDLGISHRKINPATKAILHSSNIFVVDISYGGQGRGLYFENNRVRDIFPDNADRTSTSTWLKQTRQTANVRCN